MNSSHDALGGAAIFCLGMAAAVHESASRPDAFLLEGMQDLEQVYWNNLRDAALSPVTVQLNALHKQPVRFGSLVRPNAHLVCSDYARCVLDARWRAIDPNGYQAAEQGGFDGSIRIDFTHIADRWADAALALRSVNLPDHRNIASAVQQEAARLKAGATSGVLATPMSDAFNPPSVFDETPLDTPPAGRSSGVPLSEAEIRVREWLAANAKSNPAAVTRDAVAAGTGVSKASVSRTAAWKAFRERRDAETKPGAREVPLTDAMKSVMPADCEKPDELAALIDEQKADEAEQERRHKRRSEPF